MSENSFFDSRVSVEEKRVMVRNLNKSSEVTSARRLKLLDSQVKNANIGDFLTASSKNLFSKLRICTSFLEVDPETWHTNIQYIEAKKIIETIKVVNDVAERGVALAGCFNSLITNTEEQKQYLFQRVEFNRNKFPSASTKNILKGLCESN